MRTIISSLPRAIALSKSLRALLAQEGLAVSGSDAKTMLARMLGYASWAEMKLVTGRHDLVPSPFDDGCEPEFVAMRRAYQARRLGESLQGRMTLEQVDAILTLLAPCGLPSQRWKPRTQPAPAYDPLPRQAMHPLEWLGRNGIRLAPGIAIDDAAVSTVLARQLARPWRGIAGLATHETLLAVAFALHLKGELEEALWLLEGSGFPLVNDGPSVEEALERHLSDAEIRKTIDDLASRHAYVSTVLLRLLNEARLKKGVLSTSGFNWLRGLDRHLWYALHNLGREGFFVEGAGVLVHFEAEMDAGKAIPAASVDPAIAGIKSYLVAHGERFPAWQAGDAASPPPNRVKPAYDTPRH